MYSRNVSHDIKTIMDKTFKQTVEIGLVEFMERYGALNSAAYIGSESELKKCCKGLYFIRLFIADLDTSGMHKLYRCMSTEREDNEKGDIVISLDKIDMLFIRDIGIPLAIAFAVLVSETFISFCCRPKPPAQIFHVRLEPAHYQPAANKRVGHLDRLEQARRPRRGWSKTAPPAHGRNYQWLLR